jgi:hypothetical protein
LRILAVFALVAIILRPLPAAPETEAKAIGLHVAYLGFVEDCAVCVIFEIKDDAKRTAYFASPEPDCVLLPGHIDDAAANLPERRLVLTLSPSGRALVAEKFPSPGEGLASLLVTVGGVAVGTSGYHPDLGAIAIAGAKHFESLVALFPAE